MKKSTSFFFIQKGANYARGWVGGLSANRFGGAFALSEYEKTRRGGKAGGQKFLPRSCEASLRGLPLKPFPRLFLFGTATGNRTPVTRMKTWCPNH